MNFPIRSMLLSLMLALMLAACGSDDDEELITSSETISVPNAEVAEAVVADSVIPSAVVADTTMAATVPATTIPETIISSAAASGTLDVIVPEATAAAITQTPTPTVPDATVTLLTPPTINPAPVAALEPVTASMPVTVAEPVKTKPPKRQAKKVAGKVAPAPSVRTPAPAIAQTRAQIAILAEGNDGHNIVSWESDRDSKVAYNVYWSTKPGVNESSGAKIADASSPLMHTGLTNGTTYYYVITTTHNDVESAISAQVKATPIAPGNPVVGKVRSQLCQGCHGEDGNSAETEIPKLAGQYAKYIAKQLRNYQSGTRTHQIMSAMAATISDVDLADISAFFAGQPKMHGTGSNNSLGKNLFLHGDRSRMLLACVNCHGVNGKGLTPNTSMFPVIGGQYKDYLRAQLISFRKGVRTNSPSAIMNRVTRSMTDAEIDALSEYIAGL